MTGAMSFETVDVLIYDPVAANAEATRSAAHTLGFRKIEIAGTPAQLAERLGESTPDLVICEVASAEAELCQLIQSLRQGFTGANPFAVVVATTRRRENGLVTQVINSGADDLLARPFAASLLGERLSLHLERRKGFIVTSDYIGPDRRRDARPDGKSELIEVPNSMRLKALKGTAREEAGRLIAEAVTKGKAAVNAAKLRCDAFQLCLQWRLIEQGHPSARDCSDMLERINALAADVKRRAAGTEHEATAKWCESVIECTEAMGSMLQYSSDSNPARGPALTPMMQLLGHAALALGEIFAPGEVKPALLDELDAVVARFNIRRPAQMVQ